jgi:hypothetical protein
MPNTITAYTTFVANTPARAAEVNANLANHRGTLVPINEDSASASDNTHDNGTDEHRWRVLYTNSLDFETSTNTATLVLQGQTSNTTGAFEFLIEGVTGASIEPGKITTDRVIGTQRTDIDGWSLGETLGGINFSTFTNASGLKINTIGVSTIAAWDHKTSGENLIRITPGGGASGGNTFFEFNIAAISIRNVFARVQLLRDGLTISSQKFGGLVSNSATAATTACYVLPASAISFIDSGFVSSAGSSQTVTYTLEVSGVESFVTAVTLRAAISLLSWDVV